jgi:hypothetical protein
VTQVRSLEEAQIHIASLTARIEELERKVSDHEQRFDTLQTRVWKRAWFRINGWPGQNDLNAERPRVRPWHRWWRP